ncbi:26S proteasome non-ATPase regulatory subunit 2 [Portunus trituberculatus]|uniref:26S proteasome non-ATPase regulatory subunit 2 n=1 Tax=Portunus trituberculatus TaxID=210409 RepID=A0A5B7HWR3_PORTR|nr:26S proteasome non-ATPase regulatory subunit 2 [Portunus trituberculatus]
MLSATASLGLILLWDVDGGLTQIDKYLYSSENFIKSGALLACGIVNSGVRNECDPALALLSDYISHRVTGIPEQAHSSRVYLKMG